MRKCLRKILPAPVLEKTSVAPKASDSQEKCQNRSPLSPQASFRSHSSYVCAYDTNGETSVDIFRYLTIQSHNGIQKTTYRQEITNQHSASESCKIFNNKPCVQDYSTYLKVFPCSVSTLLFVGYDMIKIDKRNTDKR